MGVSPVCLSCGPGLGGVWCDAVLPSCLTDSTVCPAALDQGDMTFVAMVQGEGGGAAAAGPPAAIAGPSGAAPASGSPAAAIVSPSISASAAAGVESEKGEAVGVDPKSVEKDPRWLIMIS